MDPRRAVETDVTGIVTKLLARHTRSEEQWVLPARSLDELRVDLLALVEIVTYLEARFGLSISGEDALGWRTVADIIEFVDARAGNQAA